MKKLSLLSWLLLLPAFLLLLVSLAVCGLILSIAPPVVSGMAVAVLAVAAVWFFLVRRRGAGAATESGLMGRQASKEGLL